VSRADPYIPSWLDTWVESRQTPDFSHNRAEETKLIETVSALMEQFKKEELELN